MRSCASIQWLVVLVLGTFACATATPKPVIGPASTFHSPWRELRTENFLVQTNLDEPQAVEVAGQLELLRGRVLEAMTLAPRPQTRLQVVVFANHQELEAYAGQAAGEFVRSSEGQERILLEGDLGDQMRRSAAHEIAHYLSFYSMEREPRWFAEGLASWLSDCVVDAPLHVRMQGLLKVAPLSTRRLFDWNEENPDLTSARYVSSWFLVEMLAQRHAEGFKSYQQRLALAEDPVAAWNAVFPDWNQSDDAGIARLDAALQEHWRTRTAVAVPPERATAPRVAARIMSAAQVHTLLLELPRNWGASALRGEIAEALADDPGSVAALIRQTASDPRSGRTFADKAIAAHPEDPQAWRLLATTLSGADSAGRESALRKAAALAPGRIDAAIDLSAELLSQERAREAVPIIAGVVAVAPWSATALLVQAQVLNAAGECKPALAAAHHAIDVGGDHLTAGLRELARANVQDLERKCGSPAFARATILGVRARQAVLLGNDEQAAQLLRQATALDPLDRQAWASLGFVLLRLDRGTEAVAALEKELALVPNHSQAWNLLGVARESLGQFTEAEAAYRKQLAVTADDRPSLYNLGRLLLRGKRAWDARAPLERLLTLDPRNLSASASLARVEICSGDGHSEAGQQQSRRQAHSCWRWAFRMACPNVEGPRDANRNRKAGRERDDDIGENHVGPAQAVHDRFDDLEHRERDDAVGKHRAKNAPSLHLRKEWQTAP
jgi:Flp pilus assembly protein TadD